MLLFVFFWLRYGFQAYSSINLRLGGKGATYFHSRPHKCLLINLFALDNFFKRGLISTNLSTDKAIHSRNDGKLHVLL